MRDMLTTTIRIMLGMIVSAAILLGVSLFDCAAYADGEVTYHDDGESAAAELREAMKQRKGSVTIGVSGKADEETLKKAIGNLIDLAAKHTGAPDEGDYLSFQFASYKGEAQTTLDGLTPVVEITYKLAYYDTAEQEAETDTKVKEIMTEIATDDLSDYEKIAAIHDYICENTEYEPAEDSNDIRRTAYGALVEGKAVCQGYSAALYRLLLEAGIDNRIIFGTGVESGGIEGPHTWNIVELGGEYYYIDLTWDDSTMSHDYFLLPTGSGFEDEHIASPEYDEDFFTEQYPLAKEEYREDITTYVKKTLRVAKKVAAAFSKAMAE